MINGSDMLNVRKSMQSSTLQTIKDIQELVEHSAKSTIPVFYNTIYTTLSHLAFNYFNLLFCRSAQ